MKLKTSASVSLLLLMMVAMLGTVSPRNVFAVTACEAIQANGGAVPNRKCIRKRDLSRDVVRNVNMADDSVDSSNVVDNSITSADIQNGTLNALDLGPNSVGSSEVASNSVPSTDLSNEAGADFADGDQFLDLTGTDVTARAIAITAPTSGYVIVNASGYFDFNENLTTDRDFGRCSITTGTNIDFDALIPGAEASLTTEVALMPFAATRGFTVGAGTTTFRLVCDQFDGDVAVSDTSITAIFVPTLY